MKRLSSYNWFVEQTNWLVSIWWQLWRLISQEIGSLHVLRPLKLSIKRDYLIDFLGKGFNKLTINCIAIVIQDSILRSKLNHLLLQYYINTGAVASLRPLCSIWFKHCGNVQKATICRFNNKLNMKLVNLNKLSQSIFLCFTY